MMEMLKRNKAYRGIPTSLNVDFYTKARGTITATCSISANVSTTSIHFLIFQNVFDDTNELFSSNVYLFYILCIITYQGISQGGEWQVVARLTDSKDELVAKCTVNWNIQNRNATE